MFDMFLSAVAEKTLDPNKFKAEVLSYSGCTETSPFYFMAMGFYGGLEISDRLQRLLNELDAAAESAGGQE